LGKYVPLTTINHQCEFQIKSEREDIYHPQPFVGFSSKDQGKREGLGASRDSISEIDLKFHFRMERIASLGRAPATLCPSPLTPKIWLYTPSLSAEFHREEMKNWPVNFARSAFACKICSTNEKQVLHNHYSSKGNRLNSTLKDGLYYCETCKDKFHGSKTAPRRAVLVSASSLHKWWGKYGRRASTYDGDVIHIDYLTIPGARVPELAAAWKAENPNIALPGVVLDPQDVCAFIGINDIGRGCSAKEIMSEMKLFSEMVLSIPGSTFVICTVPFPPKFARFDETPTYVIGAKPNVWNRRSTIIELNDLILAHNKIQQKLSNTDCAPRFHTFGLDIEKEKKEHEVLSSLSSHRLKDWREEEYEKMLHLNDHKRLAMGKSVVNYFLVLYSVITRYAETKKEGKKIEKKRTKKMKQKQNKRKKYVR
jgi:hypothetical protein